MNPTYDFSGQVAFVTGASQGMGLATAKAFAQSGAKTVLTDIDESAVEDAAEAIRKDGGEALGLVCDVSDEAQVEAAVRRTVEQYGRLDMAYNNAGIQVAPSDPADQDAADYEHLMGVNLRGVWASMKHELAQMREQGSGAIVNCSSIGGLVGNPELGAYHASKHGVLGLTKSAAIDYAPRGIRINAICPGTVETPMVSGMDREFIDEVMRNQIIGRLGQPEEIAAAVLWLCSPGASFVIGVALPVDGGYTTN